MCHYLCPRGNASNASACAGSTHNTPHIIFVLHACRSGGTFMCERTCNASACGVQRARAVAAMQIDRKRDGVGTRTSQRRPRTRMRVIYENKRDNLCVLVHIYMYM